MLNQLGPLMGRIKSSYWFVDRAGTCGQGARAKYKDLINRSHREVTRILCFYGRNRATFVQGMREVAESPFSVPKL